MLLRFSLMLLLWLLVAPLRAEQLTIAAASDLRFAMEDVVELFRRQQPADRIDVVYGSSGKFVAQIGQGAPYDLFFSADSRYPQQLVEAGLAGSAVKPYALGRLVLWSKDVDAAALSLQDLADPRFRHIAIANPQHAPYGQRAEEALRAARVWEAVESRLVLGENIAQAAQFVETGAADIGIIALALARNPALAATGSHALISDSLHSPLLQAFVITKRAEHKPLAAAFAAFLDTPAIIALLQQHGFALPAAP
jgi:molybdate transport system substrate-binding protein